MHICVCNGWLGNTLGHFNFPAVPVTHHVGPRMLGADRTACWCCERYPLPYDKKPLDPKYFQNPPCHFMGEVGGGAFCSEPPLFSAKWLQYTISILQNGLSITHGVCFSRKWLGLLPRVDHFVDWCRSEDRPCFYDCVEKSSGKEL